MDAPPQSGRGALLRCSIPLDLTAKRRLKSPRHLAGALLYGRLQANVRRAAVDRKSQTLRPKKSRICVRQGGVMRGRIYTPCRVQRRKFKKPLCHKSVQDWQGDFTLGRRSEGQRLARYTLYHTRLSSLDPAAGAANVLSKRINNATVKGRAVPSLLS